MNDEMKQKQHRKKKRKEILDGNGPWKNFDPWVRKKRTSTR